MARIGIQLWINRYVYEQRMNSDTRKMSSELRVAEKSIEKAIRQEDSSETALVFSQCLKYLVSAKININELLKDYFGQNE